ncbi:hypothetical protein ACTMU2_11760 [Cupriavidus basilensis]
MYLESITDPAALARAAALARSRGAGIVGHQSGEQPARRARGGVACRGRWLATSMRPSTPSWRATASGDAGDIGELVRAVPLYLQGRAPGRGRAPW